MQNEIKEMPETGLGKKWLGFFVSMIGMLAPLFVAMLISSLTSSCAGSPIRDSGAVFSDVQGREWMLAEVKGAAETIHLDRQQLDASGFRGAYTLTFGAERLSGKGAPNRYFGPYTTGEGRALSIGNIASTLMMGIGEPQGILEHDYFAYLGKVTRWDLRDNALELYTFDDSGAEKILHFILE
jgi:heat shock protein HslJ